MTSKTDLRLIPWVHWKKLALALTAAFKQIAVIEVFMPKPAKYVSTMDEIPERNKTYQEKPSLLSIIEEKKLQAKQFHEL